MGAVGWIFCVPGGGLCLGGCRAASGCSRNNVRNLTEWFWEWFLGVIWLWTPTRCLGQQTWPLRSSTSVSQHLQENNVTQLNADPKWHQTDCIAPPPPWKYTYWLMPFRTAFAFSTCLSSCGTTDPALFLQQSNPLLVTLRCLKLSSALKNDLFFHIPTRFYAGGVPSVVLSPHTSFP